MASMLRIFSVYFLILISTVLFADDQILIETIDQAKIFATNQNYQEAASQLEKALSMINEIMLSGLTAHFPEPLGGWRADDVNTTTTNISNQKVLKAKRNYYKEGGGQSVDIEMVINSIKIGSIKAMFSSPVMLKRAGENLKINTVADRRCIERFDPIDRYAEFIFVPTSSLMITIIGQSVKDTKLITKYAEKIDWEALETKFP